MKYIPAVLCIIGAIALGIEGIEKWWIFVVAAIVIFHLAHDEANPLDELDPEVLDALSQASEAIHAFEDENGRMPVPTSQFFNLQAAVKKIDKAIDNLMEVA